MKNAYIVMADTDYDGSTPIRVFETKGDAVAFRDRCVLYESNRPEYPSILEDTAALAEWRKRHPGGEVAGYRNLFSVLELPFERRAAAQKETP